MDGCPTWQRLCLLHTYTHGWMSHMATPVPELPIKQASARTTPLLPHTERSNGGLSSTSSSAALRPTPQVQGTLCLLQRPSLALLPSPPKAAGGSRERERERERERDDGEPGVDSAVRNRGRPGSIGSPPQAISRDARGRGRLPTDVAFLCRPPRSLLRHRSGKTSTSLVADRRTTRSRHHRSGSLVADRRRTRTRTRARSRNTMRCCCC